MRYVGRDASGNVVESSANRQPGRAEEELPDDHPDVLAFDQRLEQLLVGSDPVAKTLRILTTAGVITPKQEADAITDG